MPSFAPPIQARPSARAKAVIARSTAGPPVVPPRASGAATNVARAPTQLDATLARAVQERANAALLQRFWIKEGGAYRWDSNNAHKAQYIQTTKTYWNRWHWGASPVFVPAREAIDYSSEMLMGWDAEAPGFSRQVFADLNRIAATAIGRKLLAFLATARHRTKVEPSPTSLSSGPVTDSPMRAGSDPRNPLQGAPPTVRVHPGEAIDAIGLVEQIGHDRPPEPAWNPTASHVALFHELVHAYHYTTGTSATGPLTAEQAVHAGDVGISMSEYQATGLDTIDEVPGTQFSHTEEFTENAYRAELHLPIRDAYIPGGYRVVAGPAPLVFV